jgi:hypothetical protein
MNPLQFKYTITMTQSLSPSKWNMPEMYKQLVKVRNTAYDTEAQLIEKEMDKRGYVDAQEVIKTVMSKK